MLTRYHIGFFVETYNFIDIPALPVLRRFEWKDLPGIWGVVECYALTAPWNALERLMDQLPIKVLLPPQEYPGILEE